VSGILVVDDDPEIAAYLLRNLRQEGFDVRVAATGAQALDFVRDEPPDLVVLDIGLPDMDGLEVVRRLRHGVAPGYVPVILLAARDAGPERLLGLAAGADECLVKPFDPLELVTRIRFTLRRTAEFRAMSPLTGMPGNTRIEGELARRILDQVTFALCYADLDNFKAFNDRYGFLRGDEMIGMLATALKVAADEAGAPQPFLGHVGGDDFVAICETWQAQQLCSRVCTIFDQAALRLHDADDVARGGIEILDRLGQVRSFPLVSVSIGVATSERRRFGDYREVVAIATEMKAVAKRTPGSAVAVDRRADLVER
jgi:diguanylate cyclase (GGDEF)-like protein